jgi:Transposase IS66 family
VRGLTGYRQRHPVPILTAFADWLAEQGPRVLPKSTTGEAVTYATNQWPSLVVYTRDGRLTIDNGPAEQAARPLAIGRRNWLHVAGDGGPGQRPYCSVWPSRSGELGPTRGRTSRTY